MNEMNEKAMILGDELRNIKAQIATSAFCISGILEALPNSRESEVLAGCYHLVDRVQSDLLNAIDQAETLALWKAQENDHAP